MDVATFEHWLGEIAALNLLQRRQAWQALALSGASDSYDGETGEPLGAGIASVSIAEAPGEPSAAMTSSAVRPLNRVGTDFVAELGQRRGDSIGCPHFGRPFFRHWKN